MNEGNIYGNYPIDEKSLNLAEKDRNEIRPALVDRCPDVRAGEKGNMAELSFHLGTDIVRGARGQDVDDLDIPQIICPADHGFDQLFRLGTTRMDVHTGSAPDRSDRLIGRTAFAQITFDPRHGSSDRALPRNCRCHR